LTEQGLIFGKYAIQHRLAVGGMGEVFYAMQRGVRGFERPVILKSLLPDLARDEAFVEQFLDEARVAATLNHPNVVSIYEVGAWNGTYFIAMEYIRGRHLGQLVRRAQEQQLDVPTRVAARIIADAARGLHHAHIATDGAGAPLHVVHRDVSPQNIMLREDGVTKVLDFGIARASNRNSRTATGTVKGKLAYMPPEQALGTLSNSAVDQYALGVCLWELFTGRRLFQAESEIKLFRMVLESPVAAPSTIRGGLAPMLDAIVLRALERAQEKRFPSCEAMAQALEEYLVETSEPGVEGPAAFMKRLGTADLEMKIAAAGSPENFVISLSNPGPTAAPEGELGIPTGELVYTPVPRPRRWARVGAAAAVLATLVGSGVYWWASRPAPPAPTPPPAVVAVAKLPEPVVPALPPSPGRLTFTVEPARAEVKVDGRPLADPSRPLEVSPDQPHHVSIDAPGYAPWQREVSVAAGAEVAVAATLVAAPTVRRAQPGRKQASAAVASGAVAAEHGFLSVATTPWTKVSANGEPLGTTPIFKRRLPPGVYRLELVNEPAGFRQERSVTITAGEVSKVTIKLE
jgi:serine/threonine protein kinase